MFLVLTTVSRYDKNKDAWTDMGPVEMRFNINHIVRYAYDGKVTWVYLIEHNVSANVFKVNETDKQIDAMCAATDPTAAKVLFGKSE